MTHDTASEVSIHHEHQDDKQFYKMVKKITILLSVVTVIELCLGLLIYKIGNGSPTSILLIKGIVTILSLAKAFYITAYFMHLRDEIRNFIMTIVVPLALFVWFIIAFLADGHSWKVMKNTNAGSVPDKTKTEQVITTPAIEHKAEQ